MKFSAAFAVFPLLQLPVSALSSLSSTKSPVEKVVTLLQELKQRLESDNTNEQQSYDKYACWCEETTSRKATAIDDGRAELRSLGQQILSGKSLVVEKTLEIEEDLATLKENEEAQELATSIRQKENAAYSAESAEMKQAINALEKATTILKEATSPALLQNEQEGEGTSARAAMKKALAQLPDILDAAPVSVLAKFDSRNSGGGSRLQMLSLYAESLSGRAQTKYTPQSATIQGILEDMYDTFAEDLEKQDGDEASLNTAYETLMATKQEEVIILKDKIQKAEKVKAEAETMLTEALQTYEDTEVQLKDDVAFFDATKSACTSKSQDWSTRKSLRAEELTGISEALAILTSDDARALFGKTISPGVGFLQLRAIQEVEGTEPAQKAVRALRRQAAKTHSIRLAAMAAKLQLVSGGHFGEVITAIDTMMGVLREEGTADFAARDMCRKELHDIESKMKDLNWKIEVNNAEIAKLEKVIEKLEALETKTIEDLQLVGQQIIDLTSNRTQENSDFLTAKGEDEEAVALLMNATQALTKYYSNNSIELGPTESGKVGASFLQAPNFARGEDDAPETEFSGKGKRKIETKGVVALLETIVEDLNTEIANAVKAEEAAQLEYEAQKKAAEDLQSALTTKKTNLASDIAARKGDKSDEEGKRTTNEDDLGTEVTAKEAIEPDCNTIERKFEDRKTKREAEMAGLREAKDYLAGYEEKQGEGSSLAQAKSPHVANLRGQAPLEHHVHRHM